MAKRKRSDSNELTHDYNSAKAFSSKRQENINGYTKYHSSSTASVNHTTFNNQPIELDIVRVLDSSNKTLAAQNTILSLGFSVANKSNNDKDAIISYLRTLLRNKENQTTEQQRQIAEQQIIIDNLESVNSQLQHELLNKDLVVEKLKYSEKKIDKIKENTERENQQLALEINLLKKQGNQINKDNITDFLAKVTGVSLSDKTLVDINFKDKTFTISGREKVSGANQQGRHIIAHAFLTEALRESIRIYDSPKDLFKKLTEIFLIFCNYKNGLCLTEEQYLKLKLHDNIYSKKVITDKNIFYFIDGNKKYWVPCKDIGIDKEQANKLYQEKYKKLITHHLNELYKNINDNNTLIITCEILAKFIYFTFNKDNLISYSEAGNSLNYEIHLYKNSTHALNNKNKPYEVISHKQALDQKNDITGKIRISFNEGTIVKQSKSALRLINEIIKNDQEFKDNADKIKEFNNAFNKPLVSENSNVDLALYNNKIELHNIKTKIIYQICKYLYFPFDFKPLENNVLLPTDQETKIEGFYGASTKDLSYFTFENGKKFRDQERKDHSGKIPYRKEEVNKETLATKIVDYINLILLSYSNFCNAFNDNNFGYKIVKYFSNLISSLHNFSDNFFKDYIKSKVQGLTSKHDSTNNVNNESLIEQAFSTEQGQDTDIITILGLFEDN